MLLASLKVSRENSDAVPYKCMGYVIEYIIVYPRKYPSTKKISKFLMIFKRCWRHCMDLPLPANNQLWA